MMRQLKPWAYGPFEILLHAELHYRVGEDFDRRIAMVGFDNAIEVAITTYLGLHPMHRGNRPYSKTDVEGWLKNYHTKIDFFFQECVSRQVAPIGKCDEIVWFHGVRNDQYHNGGATVPQKRELDGVRAAALEVFAVLFEVADAEAQLDAHISERQRTPQPRTAGGDRLIDSKYGLIDLCGQKEYSSELLYAVDPNRYYDTIQSLGSDAETEDQS
jgi:hypothetical protein